MPSALAVVLQLSLALLVFAVGLQTRDADVAYLWRHPRKLLAGLVAVNLVVPAVAVAMVLALPIPPATRAGLVAMSIAPMAPFLPGKMLKLGAAPSYAVGLYLALSIAAVVFVPASIWLVGRISGREIVLPLVPLARFVLTSVLIPVVAGRVAGKLCPGAAQRAAKWAARAAFAVISPLILFMLAKTGGALAALTGDGTLLAIAVSVAAGLAVGHVLGGPERTNRAALANAAIARHPGIALLVVRANAFERRSELAVILFLLGSVAASAVYAQVMGRTVTNAAERRPPAAA